MTNTDDDQADRVVEARIKASRFMQTLKCRGKQTVLYYKDLNIQQYDDASAMKIHKKDNPGVDMN